MSQRVLIGGEETEIFQAFDVDGFPIIENGHPLYITAGGVPVRVVSEEREAAVPDPVPVPGPSKERAEELWPEAKVLFLIELFKNCQSDLRNRKKSKREVWEMLTEAINQRFNCNMTFTQIENKWRALEKKYRAMKQHNSMSGSDRRTCDFEEQLAEVFETMHSFNPVYVTGAGRRRILSAQSAASSPQSPAVDSPQATTSRGSMAEDVMELHPDSQSPQLSPAQQPSPAQEPSPAPQLSQAQQPPQGPSARRPRQDPNRVLIEGFLNYLRQAEGNRERRHNEVMTIYREAVTVIKQVADVVVQQHHQQHPAPGDL